MKNSKQCDEVGGGISEEHFQRSKIHLMSPNYDAHATFNHVNVGGSNAGSTMTIDRGGRDTKEPLDLDRCCINIYISNNIQGVTNSVVVGSDVKMVECSVGFSLEGVMSGGGNKKRSNGDAFFTKWGFKGILLFACISFPLIVSLILAF
ncbi:hypothetical protein Nepgr_032755 [Nepenthes gracilis]|uniref:Transmembrane protein n=1 Tax=Nepenthes gracilis TaxID=150966 RepID=A0AAD3Y609_NEPGR|nr:hypothetical protein Nepgr_032755 [Nepenthes gracilis]